VEQLGVRDNNTFLQADVTYRVDANSNSWNEMKGRIKDGVLYTDTFDFRMIGDPFHLPKVTFNSARMRIHF
jgi:hypothetical protein